LDGANGNEMNNIGKNISILAKVTQVSNVAHGPLVGLYGASF
jgi:DNA repair ATPase RecN